MSEVSIIIPVYNRKDFINKTLLSILSQKFVSWECIIVDDQSDDGTYHILEKWSKYDSRFRVFKRPNFLPKGANSCRNYGFEKSSGKFICWFDSDDLMKNNYLFELYNLINQKYDVVVCRYKVLGSNETVYPIYSENFLNDLFLENIRIGTPNCLWRKSYFNEKELFDVNVTRSQDWEFNLRVFNNKCRIKFIDKELYYYRRHNSSITTSNYQLKPLQTANTLKIAIIKNRKYLLKNKPILSHLISKFNLQLSLMSELKQFKKALFFNFFHFQLIIFCPRLFINFFYSLLGIFSMFFLGRGHFLFNKKF